MAIDDVKKKCSPGRPLKFPDPKSFADKIDDYFNQITVTKPKLDDAGNYVYNNAGQQAMITEYIEIPSVLGMCEYLDISRESLGDYEIRDGYSDTIKRAKSRIERYLADQLQRNTQVAGIIFNLKNNFGWIDKQEIEQTGTNPALLQLINVSSLSSADLASLEQILSKAQIPETIDQN